MSVRDRGVSLQGSGLVVPVGPHNVYVRVQDGSGDLDDLVSDVQVFGGCGVGDPCKFRLFPSCLMWVAVHQKGPREDPNGIPTGVDTDRSTRSL